MFLGIRIYNIYDWDSKSDSIQFGHKMIQTKFICNLFWIYVLIYFLLIW